MDAKHIGQAAQRPAAAQVAIGVVDLLQPIQVEQQNGERSSRTPRSFDLRVEDVEQSAVIAQACKGVGNRQKPCLRFRLFALRQVESRNKAARFAIKINRCCGDVEPTLLVVSCKNPNFTPRTGADLLWGLVATVYDWFPCIGVDKIPEIH